MLLVLSNDRRQILHCNVTTRPTAEWIARQLLQACGPDENSQYLTHDHEAIYVNRFRRQAKVLGIKEVITSPRSPWQNAYAERVIKSIRRECVDHVVALGGRHLKRILSQYVDHHNQTRTHLSLDKDALEGRKIQTKERGRIVSFGRVGGLHHECCRIAA